MGTKTYPNNGGGGGEAVVVKQNAGKQRKSKIYFQENISVLILFF